MAALLRLRRSWLRSMASAAVVPIDGTDQEPEQSFDSVVSTPSGLLGTGGGHDGNTRQHNGGDYIFPAGVRIDPRDGTVDFPALQGTWVKRAWVRHRNGLVERKSYMHIIGACVEMRYNGKTDYGVLHWCEEEEKVMFKGALVDVSAGESLGDVMLLHKKSGRVEHYLRKRDGLFSIPESVAEQFFAI